MTTPLTLDAQLCFALYSASRAMTSAYRDVLTPLGLTYTQYTVLLALWEHEPMTMREMSAHLHLDSATLSPLLQRMERDDLVTRRRVPADERLVEVALTERARDLYDEVSRCQQIVEGRTGLDDAHLAQLRGSLTELAERLRLAKVS